MLCHCLCLVSSPVSGFGVLWVVCVCMRVCVFFFLFGGSTDREERVLVEIVLSVSLCHIAKNGGVRRKISFFFLSFFLSETTFKVVLGFRNLLHSPASSSVRLLHGCRPQLFGWACHFLLLFFFPSFSLRLSVCDYFVIVDMDSF